MAYWLHALKSPAPLFPLSLFHTAAYRIGLLGNLFARLGSSSLPFLIPLTLQLGLGGTPLQAGLMTIPTAISGIVAKRLGTPLIERLGYRRILVANTFVVGLAIASFALVSLAAPDWLQVVQLTVFGCVNSVQLTAMNTLALKDLEPTHASSGNGLLSVVQMLSMSLGIAVAGSLLASFSRRLSDTGSGNLLEAFHMTFFCAGLVTAASACIFWQLEPDDAYRTRPCEEIEMGA